MTEELLTFHEVVNHMQEEEEEVLDSHHSLIEQQHKWLDADKRLLRQAEHVDYDVESYAQQLETLLSTKIDAMVALRGECMCKCATLNCLLTHIVFPPCNFPLVTGRTVK